MSLLVFFTPRAQRSLLRQRNWYRAVGGEPLAMRFDQEISDVVLRIQQFPASSPIWQSKIRRTLTTTLRLAVYYRIQDDRVVVLSLVDQRQNPRDVL